MNIGWIGLGSIGTEMVKRLRAEGHDVTVYPRGKGLAAAEAAGARTLPDYAALAAASELLVVCVFADAQVREVLFDRGALAAMRPGSIVAVHTTGSPKLAAEIGARAPQGVGVLDACFSGGAREIAAVQLTLIVGGGADVLARARPAFAAYAATIHHVGPLGSGQKMKLLNNLIFCTNLMNAAALLELGEGWGFETSNIANVLQTSSGASFAMGLFKLPRPIAQALNGVRPYMVKDVAAAAAAAQDAGLDISPFAATMEYFKAK